MNRAARRRGDRPGWSRRDLYAALGGVALLLVAALIVVVALAAGGDGGPENAAGDDDGGTPAIRTPSTGGTVGGPQPVLDGPAVRYAAAQEEIGGRIQAVPNESSPISQEMFASAELGPFTTIEQGREKVREWGYQEGYLGIFQPDGLNAGLLQGRYYVRLEIHLFTGTAGAIDAYNWFVDLYGRTEGSQSQDVAQLANQSSGWKKKQGAIPSSNVEGVAHRFIFRRGNMVGIVQTSGADTFMTIDPARDIAVIIDDRALGNRAAPTPTPSGGALPPVTVPTP